MKIELSIENLIDDILNSTTLQQAKIYAKIIKDGIHVDYVNARFTHYPTTLKIQMIKDIRTLLDIGLKEAKDFVEGASEIKMDMNTFIKLQKTAVNNGGVVQDMTPNSIRFIKDLAGS